VDSFELVVTKRWDDLKHIETERHWILGSYAVVVAGILAYLAQTNEDAILAFGYGMLVVLSFLGWLHTLRAAWMLLKVQDVINELADNRVDHPGDDPIWIGYFRYDRGSTEGRSFKFFISELSPYRFYKSESDDGRWHITFTSIYAWVFPTAFLAFLGSGLSLIWS